MHGQEGQLGFPVSVLVGHGGPVTFVDFSRVHASALLSSSYDGTCRVWDATQPSQAPKVLPVSSAFGPTHGVTRSRRSPFHYGSLGCSGHLLMHLFT